MDGADCAVVGSALPQIETRRDATRAENARMSVAQWCWSWRAREAQAIARAPRAIVSVYCGRNVSVSLSVPLPPDAFVPSTERWSFVVAVPMAIFTASAPPGSG